MPQFADGSNVQVLFADTTRGIDTRMTVPGTDYASFTLTPPDGKPLTAGVYNLVGEEPYGVTVPELRINNDYMYGEFDILDLASSATGQITRFDAVLPGVGEFRFGEDPARSVIFGARSFVFAKTFVGLPRSAQVETVHNTSSAPVTLGTPTITGANATSFSTSNSMCKTTLAAGAACTFNVNFQPRAAGPASAAVTMKVGLSTRTVPLTGSAYLGSTGITSSGNDVVDHGQTTKATSANTLMTVGEGGSGWTFNADSLDGSGSVVSVRINGPGDDVPLPVGTRNTYPGGEGNGYSIVTTVHSIGCDTSGTETVKQFTLDPVTRLPDTVNMSFTQYCFNNVPQTGTLQWQARADVTAPAAPTAVKVSSTSPRTVTWKPSTSSDAKSVVARLVQGDGARATAQSGLPLAVSGLSATVPSVPARERYTVAVFAVDAAGNVSKAATATFGTAPQTVTAPGRPTITHVATESGSVTVSFTPPASNGGSPITSYVLSTVYGWHQVSGTSSPLVLTDLPAGTNEVQVTALNAAGRSPASYAVSVQIG
ncbi:choice-of-anchor D domain-containing protein [Curtobacterium sp. ISL-83]|uniref:choice-of-anchor D domain-containing protein n=1 Tax=Curtobacterium sp. ISL-83 TaxID=2819145 RepID=UPI001BE7B752|nr:choice-of-anchor D domain-containing protein [Curtobacterium sp. ISL-83]MBT2501097.1 choice-of-anchor D domain-containing protein [Curtobacterium sp. ISL-83]